MQVIILFDPDDAGNKAAKFLHEQLLKIKCPCCRLNTRTDYRCQCSYRADQRHTTTQD
ncbi:MAG: hypothetical protein IJT47_04190 [Selenomonadaceae bacterium]|nr:hypothetical protein [Selenomonadaceae bacterium]